MRPVLPPDPTLFSIIDVPNTVNLVLRDLPTAIGFPFIFFLRGSLSKATSSLSAAGTVNILSTGAYRWFGQALTGLLIKAG